MLLPQIWSVNLFRMVFYCEKIFLSETQIDCIFPDGGISDDNCTGKSGYK